MLLNSKAADRNCSAFKAEKEKIQARIPENKYKYLQTEVPHTWQLLNETETNTDFQQHQHNLNARWNAPPADLRNQHGFMNDWQEVRRHRGRPPTMQNRQPDNGWPVRPTQTTLDNYMDGTRLTNHPNGTDQQNPPQQNVSWEDQVMNEQNMAPTYREPPPLEYV